MRDPARCTLTIGGVLHHTDSTLLARALLSLDEMESVPNPRAPQGPFCVSGTIDVDGGEMPGAFHDILAALGLSYIWAWEKGMDYEAGMEVWLHRAQSLVCVATLHGRPALTVDDLDAPQKVEDAQRAKGWIEAIRSQGLVHTHTAHAFMAAYADDPEGLRAWHARAAERDALRSKHAA